MKRTPKEQVNEIIRTYIEKKISTTEVAKMFGVSTTTVWYHLNRNNIRMQKARYKFNESYFEKIDTSDKAYYLGLIYSDGSINIKKGMCTIKLVSTDDYILKRLNILLDCKKPLRYVKEELIKGTNYIGKARSILCITSKKVISDLEKLGLFQNKSQLIQFPNDEVVPLNLKWDFIRGYFDGDGCIINNGNSLYINFAGNFVFLESLGKFIEDFIDINLIPSKHTFANCFYIKINRLDKTLKLCELLYKDNNCIKLNRKYEKYNNFIKGDYYKKIKNYMEKHGKVHGINKHTKF